ncbi:MAG TPA: exo-alpha-sialidase [Paracoccaceae bacterium]|nr:exo-alpha-sialidase [Paracoccaceae bacterium]
METEGARLSRRAVLGGAMGGLALAALSPQTALAAAVPEAQVRAIVFDDDAPILASDGLWRSPDEGATWTELPFPGVEITALAAHADRDGWIFAGLASGGILVSRDSGAGWAEIGSGLPDAPVRALAVAAQSPDTLYAAVEGDGLWVSRDAGQRWEFAMDRPFADGAERDLLTLASVNAETGMGGIWIYAGTETGITRLPDCFCRWQDVRPGNAMDALVLGDALPPEKPLPESEPVRSLAVAPQEPAVLYAGLPSGIWKSSDAGVTWAKVNSADTRRLAVDPSNPLHVLAATAGGLLISRDGGLTWTAPDV